jgi:hypothetical protein
MPSRLKYITECFRAMRFKKCKSSCCNIDIDLSPPSSPVEINENENKKNEKITIV